MSTRWAILGAAHIASERFVPALHAVGGHAQVVASRDLDRAKLFASNHGVATAVDSYDAAINDARVDAVYVALPNSLHREWVERSLLAGKPVLCEKPIAFTPHDAQVIVERSQSTGVPVWESFAFVHQPQTTRVRELVAAGTIGDLRTITARFHFDLDDPGDIRWSPALGGGATLDVGCYMCKWAREMVGPPTEIFVQAVQQDGVDAEVHAMLSFHDEASMFFSCGFSGQEDTTMVLYGTRGSLTLTQPWHPGTEDTLTLRTGNSEVIERHGMRWSFAPMLEHINRTLSSGETSPFALNDTLVHEVRLLESVLKAASSPRL